MLFYYVFGALVARNVRLGTTTWLKALDGLAHAPNVAAGVAMLRGFAFGWRHS